MAKKRLDVVLLEKGLVVSRTQAQALIIAGKVLVNDQLECKPGTFISESDVFRIKSDRTHPYVSRGGIKLNAALKAFNIVVQDQVGLDIGASTGGFTQVLLLMGCLRVHAVDVGHSQMDWKIRSDPKVVVYEKVNARYLDFEQIGEQVDIIVIDVSFISITKILPALVPFSKDGNTHWIMLIKPQFELSIEKIGSQGVVRKEEYQKDALAQVSKFSENIGLKQYGLIDSPITGAKGNKEFLMYWKLK